MTLTIKNAEVSLTSLKITFERYGQTHTITADIQEAEDEPGFSDFSNIHLDARPYRHREGDFVTQAIKMVMEMLEPPEDVQ